MTVLDAYAVLAYFRREPAADEVATLLRSPTVLPAVSAAQVVDQLVRGRPLAPDDVQADLAILERAGMTIAPVTRRVGLEAGRLRARHDQRRDGPLSMADCVAAATALVLERALATSDVALVRLVEAAGGSSHLLPSDRTADS